jgi:hypothetical protein
MAIVILGCGIGAAVAFRALVASTPRARIATAPQTSDV